MPDEPQVIRADLDWRTVALFLAAFVALTAVTALVRGAGRTLTWIGVGTLLALALDPLVRGIETRLDARRSVAVGAVLVSFLLGLTTLVALFGPAAAEQARSLGDDLPEVVESLGDLPVIGSRLRDAEVSARIERTLDELPERLAGDTTPMERAGRSLLGGTLAAVSTLLVTVVLLLDGQRLLLRIRRLVPEPSRPTADRLGRLAYRTIGQYFAGSVLVAAFAGVVIGSAAVALGVPLAPLLAAWVMVFNLVPQIGGAVSAIPFVVLGFTQGAGIGLACAAIFLVYQQIENNVISPLVVGKIVDLSPPATMTAALVGVSAAGVVGALVAVPLLGTAKAVYLELQSRQRPISEGGPEPGR